LARSPIAGTLLLVLALAHGNCSIEGDGARHYGNVVVPRTQEFRWSDGALPQTFDPAFAATPPDTDVVRAIFEGLTDYDSRTLAVIPGVATRWEAANSGRVWTFYLREDARWSNGDSVTASDFVRSWQRTLKIGDLAPHTELFSNIQGSRRAVAVLPQTPSENSHQKSRKPHQSRPPTAKVAESFGAEAIADHILRVHLERPDMSFPALVAHPVFRPVKIKAGDFDGRISPVNLVSNGAFLLAKTEADRVLLQRADNYWDKSGVRLEQVTFVNNGDPESALAAYRAGNIDAVTNAAFEPLATKLLAPYGDFRRNTYGALTYYSFNSSHPPFDDVRVREALTLAIDRERISADYMNGATEAAKKFFPDSMTNSAKPVVGKTELLEKDAERARGLLAEAGFPGGEAFPKIRLLINRNDQQRLVAQSVATMWRAVLNVETEIIVKNWDEYEAIIRAGEYDVVRRGLVMQTTDELMNLELLFEHEKLPLSQNNSLGDGPRPSPTSGAKSGSRESTSELTPIESESQALSELRAMPIYFASSYSLVKPYIVGFDSNVLDAPSLKKVQVDVAWHQPRGARSE